MCNMCVNLRECVCIYLSTTVVPCTIIFHTMSFEILLFILLSFFILFFYLFRSEQNQ